MAIIIGSHEEQKPQPEKQIAVNVNINIYLPLDIKYLVFITYEDLVCASCNAVKFYNLSSEIAGAKIRESSLLRRARLTRFDE